MTTAHDTALAILRDVAAGRVGPTYHPRDPDPIIEAGYYPDEYGDTAAADAEDRYERQSERALEWLERGA